MTREEILYCLKADSAGYTESCNKCVYGDKEDVGMCYSKHLLAAIKELEQEPVKIPEDSTNGDVIKAMFPNESFFNDIFLEVMHYWDYQQIVSDWWNAPYKAESE